MDDRSSLRLGAGAMASVLLHVLAALALGVAPVVWSQAPPPRDADPPRIRPGIERSHTATINWLGFETPSPHQAPQSQIDQPQLALNPSPSVADEATPAPTDAEPETAPAESASAGAPLPAKDAPPAEPASAAPLPLAPPMPIDAGAFVGPPAPAERSPAPTGANDAETPTPKPEVDEDSIAQQAPAGAGEPATDAGKEAEASSRDKPIEVVLGRPAAAEGVDIKTVRPRWTLYTRMTASPRNPLIEVHFDAAGSVARARMIEGSGRGDVDGPLMDAVYNWRAAGEAIDALPAGEGESARLILRFRISLR